MYLNPSSAGKDSESCSSARSKERSPTKNRLAVQLLLGHTKLESTVRYLDIEVDDALERRSKRRSESSMAGLQQRAATGHRTKPLTR
jgi:hypothetical protein